MAPKLITFFRLTAHALGVLSDAREIEWEKTFFVDVDIINKIARWLTKQQDLTTGAFHEKTIWFDRKMVDPVSSYI